MTDSQHNIIGKFESAEGNKLRHQAPATLQAKPQPQPEPKPEAEKSAGEAAKEAEKKIPTTAEERAKLYLEGLKAVEVTQEEARIMLDKVLFNDMYEETVELGRGVTAIVRTRTYTDTQRMLRIVEAENPTSPTHYNDILSRCNLAASLVEYRGQKMVQPALTENMTYDARKEEIERAFHARLEFVMSLPTPVAARLMDCVAKFDSKVYAVFSEGAPSDF
jgi:hypothetical protein